MKLYLKHFLQFLVIAFFMSCTSSVDFNQIENVEFNQSITSPFIFLDVDQNIFLNTNATAEINNFSNESNLDIFSSDYFIKNLVKANFTFEIENNFNRSFEVEFFFLNANDSVTFNFNVNVPQNNNFSYIRSVEGLDLLSLKASDKLRINVQLQPSSDSSILDKDVEMNLVLKSFTNFSFKVN